MTTIHPALAAFIDGAGTAIDRLNLDDGNEFAKGYRAALDDLSVYADQVESGLIEQRVIDEYNYKNKTIEGKSE